NATLDRKSWVRTLLVVILLESCNDAVFAHSHDTNLKQNNHSDQNPVQYCRNASLDTGRTRYLPTPASHNTFPAACLGLLLARLGPPSRLAVKQQSIRPLSFQPAKRPRDSDALENHRLD